MNDLPSDLIDSIEAAKIAACDATAILRWIRAGKLAGWKRCGRWFVSRAGVGALFVRWTDERPEPRKVNRANHNRAMRELARLGI